MKIALLLNSFEGPLYQALPFVMEPFSFFKANSYSAKTLQDMTGLLF